MPVAPVPPAIGLVSPCGWGNLGDAAIQDAMIQNLRARIPGARLIGITLNPPDTTARHGIPAFPLSARPRPGRWVAAPASPATGDAKPSAVREALKRVPLVRPLVLAGRRALEPVAAELKHAAGAFRLARTLDLLVVSGGGQLDDKWGGPWGGPYDLWKWTLLARAAGARVAFASVGAESLNSRSSRVMARAALRTAAYRSYRDGASKQVIQDLGVGPDDPVVADLAFSLPGRWPPAPGRTPATVGVSPMAYCDPRSWPRKDEAIYRAYLRTLADAVTSLRAQGHSVVLFTSDHPDRRSVDDVLALLPPETAAAPRIESLDDLLRVLASVDLVIASRLHGVLLALLVGRPVLALAYHRKVRDQMNALGLADHCLDIEGPTPTTIVSRLNALAAQAPALGPAIAARTAALQTALAGQYDRLVALAAG